MTQPYQEPKIEERMEDDNEPDIAVGTFFVGVLVGGIIVAFIFLFHLTLKYPTIEDAEDGRVLIKCSDDSTEWFNLPSCRGPNKKDRK